ncbi:SpaA isopeptide-forming pilin-related protein [Varibaculum massiliense]|uniref:SpaA isopeptide-forming pilin-related protein n=1 Tax=Varibaculum massiliense TaxID=1852372 RepID=UPI002888FE61|nr:SpaA isopeptide-forming pilin-related protein [Varibaculum massiliense]
MPTDPRFTYNGTEITGLTDAGKTDLQTNHELTIPDDVTKIAAEVFSGKGLTKVTLPDSVTEVAERAFYDNQIAELKAPGLIKIGEGAFQKNKLKVFESSTVEEISEGAFSDNELETLKITDTRPDDASNPPTRLTVIPANAFRDNKLTAVTLPKYVTEIDASAFANNQLQAITLPPNLQKVRQEAFSGNRIEKVQVPANITEFGPEVFSNNKRWVVLEKADGQTSLPTAVKSEKYASGFGQVAAEDAVSITINYVEEKPDGSTAPLRSPQVLQSEFNEPDGVYFAGTPNTIKAPQLSGYAVTPDSQKITPQAGEANEVTFTYKKTDFSPKISGEINKFIPYGGKGDTKALLNGVIAHDTYGNNITASLTVSPESINTNVQEAVYDVYYTATDSEGRTKTVKGRIAVGTDWPNKTICAGWQVRDFTYNGGTITGFSREGNQKHSGRQTEEPWCWPTFGDKGQPITAIGDRAFSSKGLMRLPDSWGSITSIGKNAFSSNEFTEIPKSWDKVTTIGDSAFAGRSDYPQGQLKALPKSWGNVTTLGESAFSNNKITALEAPWGKITNLPKNVFFSNQIASLPDSWGDITNIDESAFQSNQLTALPDSWGKVASLGRSAFENNKLTALKAPWGKITALPQSVFENNVLTSLPASWGKITSIGDKAFSQSYYSRSESMALPDSWGEVTSIGANAFENNPNTTLPASWGKVSKLGRSAFQNNKITAVPKSWDKITALPESVFEQNEITSLPEWGPITSLGKRVFASNKLAALPDYWDKITAIPEEAFCNNELASLPAWGPITSIGKAAFHRNRLTVLPVTWDNVTTIEPCAFAGKKVYDDRTNPQFSENNSCYSDPGPGDSNFNQIQSLPSSWGKVKTIGFQAFMGNALTALPNSWGEVSTLGEECFKDNKITALTAPWDTFTEIPRGVFLNNEIASLPSSWGNLKDIGSYAFTNNRLPALPSSWGEVEYIRYGAFANNELTALPDSWGNVKSLGLRAPGKDRASRNEPIAGVFGRNLLTGDRNNPINKDKDKNRITSLPDSLENIVELGQNTFYWMPIDEPVFTVPDAPLDEPDSDLKHPYNRLERIVALFTQTWWGGGRGTFAGFRGPVYLRPESGKNPDNITGTGPRGVVILVDTPVRVRYLDQQTGQPVAPEINRPFNSQEGDSNKNYELVPPMVEGYSLPSTQTIKLDGNAKDITFYYQKAPAEVSGEYARLNLTGRLINRPLQADGKYPPSKELEDVIGQKLRTDLSFGGDANKTTVKNGVIRVTYDPTRVEDPEVKITPESFFTDAKVVAPGVLEVKLKPNFDGSQVSSIPIHWRLKERITAAGEVFPVSAKLIDYASDGRQYVLKPNPVSDPGPVNLKGYYLAPTFKKDTANCDRTGVCRDYDDDPQGNVDLYGNTAVTFTFEAEGLKRNVRGYTIKDELPLYTTADGTKARAQFNPKENYGWTLGSDGITLTYTNTRTRLTTEYPGLGNLKLHFPGAKKQLQIENTAKFSLTPENQGSKEPEIFGSASTSFNFYKPMEITPPGESGIGIEKEAAGPHYLDWKSVIYDNKQDRLSEVTWNIRTKNDPNTTGTISYRDSNLDPRLRFTAVSPDRVFDGGKLEIISPTGEENKYQVLYSVDIHFGGSSVVRIELPPELTEYKNIQLRLSSVKKAQPRQETTTKIHTKLREPKAKLWDSDSDICKNGKCESDLNNYVVAGEPGKLRIDEAHVRVLPEGKTLQARKDSDFHGQTLAGTSGTYDVGARMETDYGDSLTRFELVDVLPAGLDLGQVTMTEAFAKLPGARYQIISNFNNTGRTAVRFEADQVNDPNEVYSVAKIQATVTNRVSDGAVVNEAFVRAQGKVKYKSEVTNDPVIGNSPWSKATNTTKVSVGDQAYITKRIRGNEPDAKWVNQINTLANAKFEYQLRLGSGTSKVINPEIYDLLPVAGTPPREESTLVNRFDPSRQIKFETADSAEPLSGWQTFYTCDTGKKQDELASANWSTSLCAGVTGLKFTYNGELDARSEVRITVPMLAGPVGVTSRSESEMGKQAVNDFWSTSANHPTKLESNMVYNTLVPPKANIELTKYGIKPERGQVLPGKPVEKKPLAGAEFGLFDKAGNKRATAWSDREGNVKFVGVNAGPGWTVKEITAPAGYVASGKAFVLSATDFSNDNLADGVYRIKLPEVINMSEWFPLEPIRGTVQFKKVDKNRQPLAGVEFTITPQKVQQKDGTWVESASAPITVRSNDKGEVRFYGVPAGKWRLTENPGNRHFHPIDPIDFTITNCSGNGCTPRRGLRLTLETNGEVVNNTGAVSLSKLGVRGMADKNKSFGQWKRSDGVIKPGATFALYEGKGTSNFVKSVTTGGSDASAMLDNLKLNQVYTLQETKAPAGYTQNDALMYFQINEAGKLLDASGKLLLEQNELLVPNEETTQESSLVITKVDPKAAATARNLKGAEFGLFKQAGDGTWPNTPVETATTSALGQAEFTKLKGGVYRVKELKAPAGYYVNPQAQYEFVVDDYKAQQFRWTANNERSRLQVFKFEPLVRGLSEDAADKVVSGTPGAIKVPSQVPGVFDVVIPLSGAKFTLYENDEKTKVQDAVDLETNDKGVIELPASVKLDPDKVYKLIETKAPAGYILKSNPISVKVSDYALVEGFTGLVTVEVPNTKDTGRITVSKLSQETGKPLAGAEFTLTGPDGTKKLVTNEVGLATFTGLTFGVTYRIQETKAPAGYKTTDKGEDVTLTAGNPVITRKRYNQTSDIKISLNKKSDTGIAMKDVVFELYREGASDPELSLTTDKDGIATFNVVPGQKYILKEISTSRGYALLPQPVNFTVDGNGNVTIISGKGNVNTVKGGNGSLTVTNYPEGKLPLSGYAGALEVLLLGCLVLGIAIVFTLFERKRK